MSFGFQTFIKGTSFDVLNAMAFNYVIDVFTVTGTGSKTYSGVPDSTLSYSMVNVYSTSAKGRIYTVNISGMTISWNVPNSVKIIVIATPNTGADADYQGFALYNYDSSGSRTIKLAPSFVPYVLNQVIDVSAGARSVQTGIPSDIPYIAFHRSNTGTQLDAAFWIETTSNGYHALNMQQWNRGCRVYLFAKRLINIPEFGFYLYSPTTHEMVWHSNCLPLNVLSFPSGSGSVSSANPLAVTNGVTSVIQMAQDPTVPGSTGYIYRSCASAGKVNSTTWQAQIGYTYDAELISQTDTSFNWAAGGAKYIDCNIYDQYYQQALGLI